MTAQPLTIGVEEFHVVDAATGAPADGELDDADEVSALLDAALERGSGAARQRRAFARRRRLADVVDRICVETAPGDRG